MNTPTAMVLLRGVAEIIMALLGAYGMLQLIGIWATIPLLVAFGVLIWYTETLDEEDLV